MTNLAFADSVSVALTAPKECTAAPSIKSNIAAVRNTLFIVLYPFLMFEFFFIYRVK